MADFDPVGVFRVLRDHGVRFVVIGGVAARLRGGNLTEGLAAGCRTARAILSRFPRKTIKAGEFAECVA